MLSTIYWKLTHYHLATVIRECSIGLRDQLSTTLQVSKPSISVAMCTYNGEAYIREQLVSILGQTRAPYELVICDDCSSDDTLSLVKSLTSGSGFPVRIFRQESNVGVNQNFATAISMCSGDYIALADQDDIWERNKLHLFSQAISGYGENRPALIFSDVRLVDAEGSLVDKRYADTIKEDRHEGQYWLKLAFGNFIPGCSLLFDSRYAKAVLPIPGEAVLHDWWIALLISLTGSVVFIDRQLIAYRIHEGNNQGINSFKRTVALVSRYGLFGIASNNFSVTLRQLQAASDRLQQRELPSPPGLGEICRIENSSRLMRPYILFKLGVRRASALLGSFLIGRKGSEDNPVGYI